MRPLARIICTVAFGMAAVAGLAACSSSDDRDSGAASSPPPASNQTFCSLLTIFRQQEETLNVDYDSGDPKRVEEALAKQVGQIELLRTKAPVELKADVDALAVYFASLDRLFAKYRYDLDAFEASEQASAEFLALTTEDIASSQLQLRNHAATQCVGGDSTTTTVAGG